MRTLNVETTTHGRVLIEDAAVFPPSRNATADHRSRGGPAGTLVGCHGYGQSADAMMDELRRIPGAANWRLVSVQALHRFYTRNDQAVVASWMTRQDREDAIADNISYLDRVVAAATEGDRAGRVVLIGFSQGASMAARTAIRGQRAVAGLIVLGGDIPQDVRDDTSRPWPTVLLGCGIDDKWYGARVDSDAEFLASRGIAHDVVRFTGGHEFNEEFREAAGRWLARLSSL